MGRIWQSRDRRKGYHERSKSCQDMEGGVSTLCIFGEQWGETSLTSTKRFYFHWRITGVGSWKGEVGTNQRTHSFHWKSAEEGYMSGFRFILESDKFRTQPNLHLWLAVLCFVPQSCPTLCNPINCSLPGSSVHGIFQAKTLEWVAIPFFRGSSQPRDWTQVSHIASRFFTIWITRETLTGLVTPRQNTSPG